MTTHAPHPDIATHGLAPGCPRCEEHAARPLTTLDLENILRLLVRREVRTELDALALRRLEEMYAEGRLLPKLLEGR